MLLTTVIAYKTRREHIILTNNWDDLREVCANRFGYERVCNNELEPNWGIRKHREIPRNVAEQMMFGNLCPRCMEWHRRDFNCIASDFMKLEMK